MACSSKFTFGKASLRLRSPLLVPYVYMLIYSVITISVSIGLYGANLLHYQYHMSMYGLVLVGLSAVCYYSYRNPKHQITPSVALSGSLFGAFDDVSVEDPDFGSIQCKKVLYSHCQDVSDK